MPTRYYPIALFLAIFGGMSLAQGQAPDLNRLLDDINRTSSQDTEKPEEKKTEQDAGKNEEKPNGEKADKEKDERSSVDEKSKSAPRGGLQPKPSADVLELISAPNIKTDGATPESAAAKRGLDSVGLPQNRGWGQSRVCWQSNNICHQPLYFEDAMLERHGHQRFPTIQPLVSGAKFFGTIPLLPYLTAMHPPCENRYALGHFRPGSCAPALKDTLPWDQRAARVQVLAVTGIVLGLPW